MGAALIAIAAVIVVVIVVMTAAMSRNRRHRHELQAQFRDEYHRAVAERGSTKEAVRDLEARTERHEQLDISPLDESHRQASTSLARPGCRESISSRAAIWASCLSLSRPEKYVRAIASSSPWSPRAYPNPGRSTR